VTPAAADPAVVERALAEAGVERTLPPPGWAEYLQSAAEAIAERLFRPVESAMAGAAPWMPAAIVLILAFIALVFVGLLFAALHRRREMRAAGPTVAYRPAPVTRALDAAAWRSRLEERLRDGAIGPALEALWWWFACSVSGSGAVERSVTSRELVVRLGRPDLSVPARELDRWIYGPRRPSLVELRELVRRLERVVA
jgi:hypothetical protein